MIFPICWGFELLHPNTHLDPLSAEKQLGMNNLEISLESGNEFYRVRLDVTSSERQRSPHEGTC